MFKCKECGTEYKEKTDYCDCGNDEFDEIISEVSENKDNIGLVKPDQHSQTSTNLNEENDKIKPQPASTISSKKFTPHVKKNNFAQYPTLSRFIKSADPISITIFCICIFLSFYVVFFAWNPVENTEGVNDVEQKNRETSSIKNMPSIDKIWNNTLPIVKQERPKKEEKLENTVKQITPTVAPKNIVTPKVMQTVTTTPKTTKVLLKKVTASSKKTVTTTAVKQQTTNITMQAKMATEDAAKRKSEDERKAAETAQLKKLQEVQAKKAAEEKAKQAALLKQEIINYKAQLRNTIGKKIDFTKVIGDGSCTVAFKIDSNGRLTNRSFAKQSSNNTLNDAVYKAVMATPTFNPPPSGYKNETLNLNIKFSNGNFEISLP